MVEQPTKYQQQTQETIHSELLDTAEKIPVQVFFTVMKTGNIGLLNPKNIKISDKDLNEIWNNLLEYYYKESNYKKHVSVIRKIKKVKLLENKITTCYSSILLIKISQDESNIKVARESLDSFGYKNKDIKFVENNLKRLKSDLEFLVKQNKKEFKEKNKKEDINFWKLVAQVEEARGGNVLNVELISLARWIAIVKEIKARNSNNTKNGRRRQNRQK